MEKALEDQQPARFQRHGQCVAVVHVRITDLPIPSLEVNNRPFQMAARRDNHAAVFDRGLVQGDPAADDFCFQFDTKIGMILMPGLFAAHPGRFEQRHILEQERGVIDEALDEHQQLRDDGPGRAGGRRSRRST